MSSIWNCPLILTQSNLKEMMNRIAGTMYCSSPRWQTLQDQGIFNSGCSRHMTGNKSFLTDYQDIDGGFVAFAMKEAKGGLDY
ncbi:hypothetical protein Tco_1491711 [Tanacetum coccineum]